MLQVFSADSADLAYAIDVPTIGNEVYRFATRDAKGQF